MVAAADHEVDRISGWVKTCPAERTHGPQHMVCGRYQKESVRDSSMVVQAEEVPHKFYSEQRRA